MAWGHVLKLRYAAASGLMAILVACQWIVGLEEPTEGKPLVCGTNLPPAPKQDTEVTRYLGLTVARSMSVVMDAGVGYNLDGLCTCDKSVSASGPACQSAGDKCDQVGGVDNALREALVAYEGAFDINRVLGVDGRITAGIGSVAMHLTGYNGLENDSQVGFGMARTLRYAGQYNGYGCDGGAPLPFDPDGGGADAGPQFNGCDGWMVAIGGATDDSTERGRRSLLEFVAAGYVSQGRVVLASDNEMALRLGRTKLNITNPRITAKIELLNDANAPVPYGDPSATRYRLTDGMIVGRVVPANVLRLAAVLHVRGPEGPRLCDPDPQLNFIYEGIRSKVCTARDVRKVRPLDGTDPAAACEALTVALRFTADPGFIGTADNGNSFDPFDPFPDVSCDDRFPPDAARSVDAGFGDGGDGGARDAAADARSDAHVDASMGAVDAAPYLDPKTYYECP